MIGNWPLLTIITFLPMIGVAFLMMIRGEEALVAQNARNVALWVSSFTLVISLALVLNFDPLAAGYQFEEHAEWLPGTGISYHLGVDGISMPFILLSTLLTPLAILASWKAITHRVREYMIAFLVLETMMIGMFASLDMLMFYLFFEGVLIPMFIIIGVWGGARRVYAAFKFFLYTLLGSVLMLVCMLVMYIDAGTTDIPALSAHSFAAAMQTWLFLGFLASFAVKVPMWPVHTWLPDAHVEAPTAGSMILAGVLLKMGGYGFIRFSLPMFPMASEFFAPLIFALSIIAIVYTSLVALAQSDMKKLIAYSSVAHMGFVTIGIFTLTEQGVAGAMFQMISHGLVSAALFFCVGGRTGSIPRNQRLWRCRRGDAALCRVLHVHDAGIGRASRRSGFVGGMLVLVGAWKASSWVALFTATGLVLGATYMLWLYRRVMFGRIVNAEVEAMERISRREIVIFAPLTVLVLWFGVYPASLLDVMATSIQVILDSAAAGGAIVIAGR